MNRPLVLAAVAMWAGTTLILSELRWFGRRPIDERLRAHVPGGWRRAGSVGILSVGSFRDVVGPLAASTGDLVGRVFGVHDDLATRLRRTHSPMDPTAFRVRQLTWSGAAFAIGSSMTLLTRLPAALGVLSVVGAPLLVFLALEQTIASESARWQRRLVHELPVVSEQIGMLLSAGYSLGSALDRIARRGSGACADDLRRVCRRVRQGLSDADALREWAALADVPAVHRLVGVLCLNRDTGDLGRLISEEARSIRREVQRDLAATIERRAQQVWIPVTVATLVPGSMFIAVPFIQAIQLFGST